MAKSPFRLNHRGVFHVFAALSAFLLVVQRGSASEFRVGGSNGSWMVPTDPNASSYNQWAEKWRFQIGDSILFVYNGEHDSVLHVTKEDYASCNTKTPINKFTDGHTVYKFTQSGPHYFISGVADNCHKNEKLVVVVLADRTKHNSNETAPSPSPQASPPSNNTAPSPAPLSSPPSPAPSGQESPSPPAPTPAGGHAPPKSAAGDVANGALGIVGALVGALLGLVI